MFRFLSALLLVLFCQVVGCQPSPPTNVTASPGIVVNGIQSLPNWLWSQDAGTTGTASGDSTVVAIPSLSGGARQFTMTYSEYGGERWYDSFASDTTATNFFYDTYIYIADSNTIANLEFDMNQVMANGQTVIYGVQCDGWSLTWDYTENTGTPTTYNDQWIHSTQICNPQAWSLNTWHHVQMSYSRDNSGNVTYQSVWLDGVEQPLNVTVNSSFALGWSSTLLTNFQIDGYTTSGSATAYLDNLTVSRW